MAVYIHRPRNLSRPRSLSIFEIPNVPAAIEFNLPMVYKRFLRAPGVPVSDARHSFHPPFAWFSFLHCEAPISFRDRFLGGEPGGIPDLLEAFWNGIPEADGRKAHLRSEVRRRSDYIDDRSCFRRAAPISLHGDAVPTARMSNDVISWAGFLGSHLATLDSKLWISGLLNRNTGDGTKASYISALVWGITAL